MVWVVKAGDETSVGMIVIGGQKKDPSSSVSKKSVNTENSFPKLSGWYEKVDGHDNVGCGGGAGYAVTGAYVRGTSTLTPVVVGR